LLKNFKTKVKQFGHTAEEQHDITHPFFSFL